jgi:hypothetical protein
MNMHALYRPLALLTVLLFVGCDNEHTSKLEKQNREPTSEVNEDHTVESRVFAPMNYSRLREILVQAQVKNDAGRSRSGIFQVDTAAQRSFLNSKIVDELKLRIVGKEPVITAGGNRDYKLVNLPSIQLGDIEVKGLVAIAYDSAGSDEHSSPEDIVGTLGADFLNGKILTINYKDWEMALTAQPPSMSGYHQIWEDPIRVVGGMVFVRCQLPTTNECNLTVDTGSSESVVFGSDMAKFIHLEKVTRSTELQTPVGRTPIKFGPIPWIVIGQGLRLSPAVIGLCDSKLDSPLRSKYAPGLLGNALMEKYIVQIDYQKRVLKLFESR